MKRLLRRPWLALIWTGLIFYLLTFNTSNIPSVPLLGIRHLDKFVHVILFGILLLLWAGFVAGKKSLDKKVLGILFIAVTGYGIGMEFYQDWFTTRAFELADIFADATGAGLAGLYLGAKNKPLWK